MPWAGAVLFAGALINFAFRYLVTFSLPAPGTPDVAAITWNVTLFSLFALHHSVFARTPLRHWVASMASSRERSVYVWIASLLFIAVCAWWKPVGGVAWEVSGALRWPLWALQAAGVWLTLRGAAVLDFRELAGMRESRAAEFRVSGPYGWVRHPIYLGWFLMVLPATPMTMTRLVFAIVSCAYLVVAIPFEEGTLRRTSQGAYTAYCRQVRWRLIPGLY